MGWSYTKEEWDTWNAGQSAASWQNDGAPSLEIPTAAHIQSNVQWQKGKGRGWMGHRIGTKEVIQSPALPAFQLPDAIPNPENEQQRAPEGLSRSDSSTHDQQVKSGVGATRVRPDTPESAKQPAKVQRSATPPASPVRTSGPTRSRSSPASGGRSALANLMSEFQQQQQGLM
eukprot:10752622-Karenia_brevis.AAC.1